MKQTTLSCAERVAKALHDAKYVPLGWPSWTEELPKGYRSEALQHAEEHLRAMESAGLAVVELPEPDSVIETGGVTTARFGPVEIRSDGFLRRMDALGYTPRERAAHLLAAAAWAERQGGDPR